ncbi:hypothetical protein [Pseudoalteromonas sp. R3]|uniref:hypothetical protein n=1 Tax=Pseudoalteromonas sp. R3 TaxID=1709477 RepID=UPI0006B64872|nr:hypothetical protein [Pseudoalteromonas sp. R3]AZZ98883.1 hypothetical protein ELR70_18315 [Pseudoalteromonas sp. R3]
MHSPYEDIQNRQPDFIVRYEIDLCDDIKNAKPHQDMRTDFLYHGDDPEVDGIYMIWPELLDENGQVIEDTTPGSAPLKGTANMWILSDEMREFHRNRLKVGTKGYWVQGKYRVANVIVIKLCGLPY